MKLKSLLSACFVFCLMLGAAQVSAQTKPAKEKTKPVKVEKQQKETAEAVKLKDAKPPKDKAKDKAKIRRKDAKFTPISTRSANDKKGIQQQTRDVKRKLLEN